MVKILVLGATGYLGFPVALGLRRKGHLVWGMTRSAAKSAFLAKQEISPVIGTFESNALADIIEKARINIVIDVSGSMQDVDKVVPVLEHCSQERMSAGVKVPKLGFIYVSGAWVHGSNPSHVDDLDPVAIKTSSAAPATAVAWRPAVEQRILGSSDLAGVIVRPALMYGGSQSAWGMYFGPMLGSIQAPKISLPADPNSMVSLVHVEDVAAAIATVVQKFDIIAGVGFFSVFDLAGSFENMPAIIKSAAKLLGFSGNVEFAGSAGNVFAEALNTTVNTSSTRARDVLGWKPTRKSMAEDIDIHVAAFLASLAH